MKTHIWRFILVLLVIGGVGYALVMGVGESGQGLIFSKNKSVPTVNVDRVKPIVAAPVLNTVTATTLESEKRNLVGITNLIEPNVVHGLNGLWLFDASCVPREARSSVENLLHAYSDVKGAMLKSVTASSIEDAYVLRDAVSTIHINYDRVGVDNLNSSGCISAAVLHQFSGLFAEGSGDLNELYLNGVVQYADHLEQFKAE